MKFQRLAILFALLFFGFSATFTQDRWTQVKSKNFFLIGNASEKNIKKVGTKLEQFREAFRLLFPNSNVNAPIPTNVVVFKNDAAYKPFKPKRANGKIDEEIAGYFQPGDDVNYITMSTGGDERDSFGIIFHEYIHFVIETNFGKADVPQWFNEGLAEYFQTFEIIDDIKVKLGLPQEAHLRLLQRSPLMPLDGLMSVTNYQLHQTGGHSRSIYYAQSWVLVHYLTQGGKSGALAAYLKAVMSGMDPAKAFEQAFQTTYAKMESELRNYVSKNTYRYNEATFKQKLDFSNAMQSGPLSEAETNAYLGDLLHHNNRSDDAEPYLRAALAADERSSLANTALGMVKINQRKYDDARTFLERAIAGDQRHHSAYYQYALLLSRQSQDEFGFIRGFAVETVKKMRDALRKSIAMAPSFAENYDLYALISLVTNEELDTAENYLKEAIRLYPGTQRYPIRLAELYARQQKFEDAIQLSERIAAKPENEEMRQRASNLAVQVKQQRDFEARNAADKKRYEELVAANGGKPRIVRRIEGVPRPSEHELAKIQEDEQIRSVNEALRALETGEKRILGKIDAIDCKRKPLVFGIKSGAETFTLTARDFTGLTLVSLDPASSDVELGCTSKIAAMTALITYKETAAAKTGPRGELIAVEFVPPNFREMTPEEMNDAKLVVWDMEERRLPSSPQPIPTREEVEAKRREAIVHGIKENLRKPAEGEKREFGFLEKIECTDKSALFHFRTGARTIRLLSLSTQPPNIIFYTPDLAGVQFGCGIKAIEFPAAFIFADKPDKNVKSDGTILSIEFVPKSFVLDQ